VKRVLFAVTATIAGLVGLLSFKSHSPAVGGTLPQSLGSGAQAPPRHPGRQPPRHDTSPTTRPHRTSAATSTPSSGAAKRYVGPAVQTPYGVVQVAITVAGSHIDHVGLVRLTAFDATSQMINSQAAPILVRETVAAQSSRIDVVSGATYTSEGYLQSLQRALDEAGLR
jgi:uncharacterized protein with FMN-binding domain